MAAEYGPSELIDILRRYVPDGREVLELGIGPGADAAGNPAAVGSPASFTIVEMGRYTEMENDDSLWVVFRRI